MQILGLFSDLLLLCATAGMAFWCRLLTRRLRAFNDVDNGVGGSIAALTFQVDDLKASIVSSTRIIGERATQLDAASARADDRIGRMEMLLGSLEALEEEAADRLMREPHSAIEGPEPAGFQPSFRASRGPAVNRTGTRG